MRFNINPIFTRHFSKLSQLVLPTRNMNWQTEKQRILNVSIDEKREHYKCGGNYLTLDKIPTWDAYAKIKNLGTNVTGGDYKFEYSVNQKVSLFTGDITSLEVDAIVNAANKQLAGGGGVDGAIHAAAGRDLLQAECRSLEGCDTGNSKITGGYKLPAKYIIHTVGPVGEKPTLLKGCYQKSLALLEEHDLKSIAFPCISTGVYAYPNENAAHVALSTVRKWFDSNEYAKHIDRVIFCLFMKVDIDIYEKLMPIYFPTH